MMSIDRVYEPTSLFGLPRSSNPDCIQLVAFSPSGTFLAATFGNTIRVWDTNNSERFIFDYKTWESMQFTSVLWNDDGLHCGYSDGGYCTIDFDECSWRFFVSGFWMGSSAIQFLAQQTGREKLLAVASVNSVKLWRRKPAKNSTNSASSLPNWLQLSSLPQPPPIHNRSDQVEVTGLSWRVSNRQHLAVCYLNHGVIIWDSNTGKSVEKIIRIPLQSISGSFSPTTSHLAVLTEFNTIDIYDVDSQSFLQTLPESHGSADTHSGKAKRCLTYSHNGCYLLAARPDSVCVWHTNAALEPQYLTYDSFDVPGVYDIGHVATCQPHAKRGQHGLHIATVLNKRFIALHLDQRLETWLDGRILSISNRQVAYKLTSLLLACIVGVFIGRLMILL